MKTPRLAALVLVSLIPAVATAATWTVASVEPTLSSTESYALRLDATGTPRVAFGRSASSVLYGVWDGQGFELETAYPAFSGAPADPASPQLLLTWVVDLAIGTDGEPRILHTLLNGTGPVPSGTLQLSTRNHGVWTVESLGASRGRPSLDIDGLGREHVAFMPSLPAIEYAVRSGAGWTYETVAEEGRDPMLRLGPDGVPYVAYVGFNPTGIRLAVRAGGGWSSTFVALENTQQGPALGIQPDGSPVIAYLDAAGTHVKFAEFDGTAWVVTPVASGGPFAFRPGLACDFAGPHVAYRDNVAQSLVVADRLGATWSPTTVDTGGNTGLDASMASDAFGRAWVLYGSADNPNAWYARRVPVAEAPVLSPPPGIALRLSGANPIAAGVVPAFQVELPHGDDVTLTVRDVSGRLMGERRTLHLDAGAHPVSFGAAIRTPGLYFVHVTTAGGASASTRLVVTAAGR